MCARRGSRCGALARSGKPSLPQPRRLPALPPRPLTAPPGLPRANAQPGGSYCGSPGSRPSWWCRGRRRRFLAKVASTKLLAFSWEGLAGWLASREGLNKLPSLPPSLLSPAAERAFSRFVAWEGGGTRAPPFALAFRDFPLFRAGNPPS